MENLHKKNCWESGNIVSGEKLTIQAKHQLDIQNIDMAILLGLYNVIENHTRKRVTIK